MKQMNETEQQLERYVAYLAADPANPNLLATVIDHCLASGALARAQQYLRQALIQFPDDSYFQARHGELQIAQQQWDAAIVTFEQLLATRADASLAYNLAYALQKAGRHVDALATLQPYMGSAELSPAMVTLSIRILHHLGRQEQAAALAEAQMASCRAEREFLAAASLACLDAGKLELAEQLTHMALALQQASGKAAPVAALVTSGSLALARADGAAAAAIFHQVLAQYPDEGRSWSGLGTASLLQRDFVAAQAQMRKAVACMPDHIGSWHMLGWSCIFNRDLQAARTAFQSALDRDRNFAESHGGLAVVRALQGERAAAEGSIERAERLDGQGLSALYAKMILSGQTEDPVRFRALAGRLLSTRQGAFGQNLGEMLDRYERH